MENSPSSGATEKPAASAGTARMSDLKLRLASAVVLGPLVLLIVWYGSLPYHALLCFAGIAFLSEWFHITGTGKKSSTAIAGYLAVAGSIVLFMLGQPLVSLGLIAIAAVLIWLVNGRTLNARWATEGLLYAGLSMLSLAALRNGAFGGQFLFFLVIVVWATDICAYFVGRFAGGPKLWRRVSPNKTWSGSLGGLVFAIVFSGLYIHFSGQDNLISWLVLAAFLSVISQAGDLAESAMKRRFSVKDSSHLIPGHGGIMDRIDGLVAAALAAAILGLALGGSLLDPVAGLGLS
ncbi:phosphatidate cytidylyltransferase [Roseibium limicola]|nr:phosphatidate cytidylyltransferase [Roseibium limicola]